MLLLNAGQYVHTRNIDLTPKASDLISLQTIQNSTGQHTGKGTDILRISLRVITGHLRIFTGHIRVRVWSGSGVRSFYVFCLGFYVEAT